MKLKTFLVMLMFLLVGGAYASFPVERTNNQSSEVVADTENKDNTTQVSASKEEANSNLSSPAASSSGKSQLVALLLCIFVGGIGIHRFYLGYTTEGILQILTLGGCGIWALIDLIRIATGDLKPKGGEYSEKI